MGLDEGLATRSYLPAYPTVDEFFGDSAGVYRDSLPADYPR